MRSQNRPACLMVPITGEEPARQQFVSNVDALVMIGGADGTYQAALELRLTRKIGPIGAFGGASSPLLAALLNSGTPREAENFEKLSNPWAPDLAS